MSAGDKNAPINLLEPELRRRAPATILLRQAVLAGTACMVTLSVLAVGLRFNTLASATAASELAIKTATAESQAIRRRLMEADTAEKQARQPRLRKIERPSVTAVWEELTARLPLSTWLTDLRLDGSTLQIEGQSANASDLIAVLSKTALFKNVAFASPVTRAAQRGLERFQIRLNITGDAADTSIDITDANRQAVR